MKPFIETSTPESRFRQKFLKGEDIELTLNIPQGTLAFISDLESFLEKELDAAYQKGKECGYDACMQEKKDWYKDGYSKGVEDCIEKLTEVRSWWADSETLVMKKADVLSSLKEGSLWAKL